MNIRPLLLGLPLLLTSCSSMSSFSWSSLSPFNWFSSSIIIRSNGVGDLNASTAMTETAISDGLHNNYRIRSGMSTSDGKIISYYQAVEGEDVKLVITGETSTYLQQIEVMDPSIATEWGSKIGDLFSGLFSKAYGSCQPGEGEDAGKVACVATQSNNVTYIFSGQWAGPQGIIPPDDTLKNWAISKIVWRATAQ